MRGGGVVSNFYISVVIRGFSNVPECLVIGAFKGFKICFRRSSEGEGGVSKKR